jgi:cell division protein ZapA (FtsZ GTPase activity inhibitor)
MVEGRAEVEILGQRIAVRGRGSPEYIRGLAEYLDRMIRTIRTEARVQDQTRLTLLAGLHVADELFRLREQAASLDARVEALARRLEETVRAGPRAGGDFPLDERRGAGA